MCSTDPFKFRWSKVYISNSFWWHCIGSINLSHPCHIFPWLCLQCTLIFCRVFLMYADVCVYLHTHIYIYIYIYVYVVHYGLVVVFVSLQITLSLSWLSRFIWRHWKYKIFTRYILSSEWLRLNQSPQLSFMQYMRPCTYQFLLWWLWEYVCLILLS